MAKQKRKINIFFIHSALQTFVKKDLDILKEFYSVRELNNYRKTFRNLFKILSYVYWSDCVYCWFAGPHGILAVLLAKLLGKKILVIAGGYDVAFEPEFSYGMFASALKKWCPFLILKLANQVLTLSENSTKETLAHARIENGKTKTVYLGFNENEYFLPKNQGKRNMVLTISGVWQENIVRKGLYLFVKSASFFPDVPFVLVGKWHDDSIDYLKSIASPNVKFTGFISDKDMNNYLYQAKVYVQVSRHEGFGCSLAEAMLCECIPVVSRLAAIPEVVGDCGIYVDKLEEEEVAKKIEEAIKTTSSLGRKAKERIITKFPLENRKQQLIKIVNKIAIEI